MYSYFVNCLIGKYCSITLKISYENSVGDCYSCTHEEVFVNVKMYIKARYL